MMTNILIFISILIMKLSVVKIFYLKIYTIFDTQNACFTSCKYFFIFFNTLVFQSKLINTGIQGNNLLYTIKDILF